MFLAVLFTLTVAGCNGALQFATYYQDHMVLQRGPQHAVIWGHATKIGDSVTVTVSGQSPVTTTVAKDAAGKGMWKVKLPAVTDVTAHTVTASSSEGSVTIKDVLFGDVWICSGQSNMGFTTGNIYNSTAEIAASLALTDIRVFRTGMIQSHSPLTDFRAINIAWTKPTAAIITRFSAVCWLFGEYLHADRKYPIGLIESAWGGTPIEDWSSPDAISTCTHRTKRATPPRGNSVLWNSMINPLLGMTIYGTIWYQGESNTAHAAAYSCQFPAMISDWRHKFHDASLGETSINFPFGFVQIGANRNVTYVGAFPALRYAQTVNHGSVPNPDMLRTFMAVAMDLPDFNSPLHSIHTRDKQDVARRLVLGARAVAYHEKGVYYHGPFPKTVTNHAATHTMTVEYQYGYITVKKNTGFDVCCSTGMTCQSHDTWAAAPIKSHTETSVVLSTSGCAGKQAVGVRYAWRESPCNFKKCAIYGRTTELPAPPYRYTQGFATGAHIIG